MTSFKTIDDQLLAALGAFFKDPDAKKLHSLLRSSLGEFNHLDFKEDFPEPVKLAKHLLGMANTRGGCIVVGVADAKANDGVHKPVGITSPTDPTELGKKLREFLPETLDGIWNILTFEGSAIGGETCSGRFFQVIVVQPDDRHLPFLPRRQAMGIDPDTVYVRRNAETVKAKKSDYDDILRRRQTASAVGGRYSVRSLDEHLTQLSQLYKAISPVISQKKRGAASDEDQSEWQKAFIKLSEVVSSNFETIKNPNFPAESHDEFVSRMIEAKKRQIEGILDL